MKISRLTMLVFLTMGLVPKSFALSLPDEDPIGNMPRNVTITAGLVLSSGRLRGSGQIFKASSDVIKSVQLRWEGFLIGTGTPGLGNSNATVVNWTADSTSNGYSGQSGNLGVRAILTDTNGIDFYVDANPEIPVS